MLGSMTQEGSWRRRYGGYAIALLVVCAAVIIQRLLWPHIPPSPQLLFYPAVLVAARCGGFGPGALTVVLSCFAMAYWFLPPEGGLLIETSEDALELAIFAAMGLTVAALMAGMRSATKRARAAFDQANEARARLDVAYRAREEMLAIVSHDLRTPLASIVLSCTQIRQSLGALDHSARASCDRIDRATHRMGTLVRNLLDAATIDAGGFRLQHSRVEVTALVDGTVNLFEPMARQKAVRLVADVDGLDVVSCDRERILQTLENLVGNALKFVPREGEVVVAARRKPDEILFEVRDSGPGIAPSQLEHVFDRYWKEGRGAGMGLGLYIAKAIVEAHGGHIWATSDGGTTIAFVLPLDRALAPEPRPLLAERSARRPGDPVVPQS
jgi:signal transduction histidine kinase